MARSGYLQIARANVVIGESTCFGGGAKGSSVCCSPFEKCSPLGYSLVNCSFSGLGKSVFLEEGRMSRSVCHTESKQVLLRRSLLVSGISPGTVIPRCSIQDDSVPSSSSSPRPDEKSMKEGSGESPREVLEQLGHQEYRARTTAESTDWISSNLSRRFGLGAGLAWVGFLVFGVVSEQIKTRTEVFLENQSTRDIEDAKEVVLPNNIKYVELRTGGGLYPQKGDLVLVDITGKVANTGQVFIDTSTGNKRSLAFVLGGRPYAGGMCEGLEYVLRTMKAGGKSKVTIPADLGFGKTGAELGTVTLPGDATLEYVVELKKVSIAPS